MWAAGNTNESPQIDQAQRNRCGVSLRNKPTEGHPQFGILARARPIGCDAECPGEQTNDIRVDERPGPVECQQQNRVRHVPAHPRKRQELGLGARHSAIESVYERPSQSRQPGAPVQEPERTQQLHDLAHLRRRELLRMRITIKEPLVHGRNEIRPRALQQELRDQDGIRISGTTPRKIASMAGEPAPNTAANPGDISRGSRSGHPSSLELRVNTGGRNGGPAR